MDDQHKLLRFLGLERREGADRRQTGPPSALPPPPPPAATQQFSDINSLTSTNSLTIRSLPAQPLTRESLISKLLANESFPAESLLANSLPADPLLLPANAIPEPRLEGSQRRQFSRKPMPFGGVAPVGEMASPSGEKWHVGLWDVSLGGICIVVDSPVNEALGTLFSLSIYENFGFGSAFFNANLRWRTTEADNTYLGLEFEDQELLSNNCFLMHYVNTDLKTC